MMKTTMRIPCPAIRVLAATAAFLGALAAASAHAQAVAGAVMLVAKPEVSLGFHQTVLVAAPLGEDGYVGFIINRPLQRTLASLVPGHEAARKVADPVRFGGPESIDQIFAVVRSGNAPGAESLPLFGDLYVAAGAEDIRNIVERTPNDARYFAGFVKWRPGELDAEIARGLWYVMTPEVELMFREDAKSMWLELVRRMGIEPLTPNGRAI